MDGAPRVRGRWGAVFQAVQQTLAANPRDAIAHANLALLLAGRGRHADAETHARQAVSLAPDEPFVHHALGYALQEQGRWAEASLCYRQTLTLAPDDADARYNLAQAFKALGLREPAIACYRALLAVHPDDAESLNNLGNLLSEAGAHAEAAALFHRVIARAAPAMAALAHNNLGNLLLDLGQFAAAERHYVRALQLRPGFALAYSNLLSTMAYMVSASPAAQRAWAAGWERQALDAGTRNAARRRRFPPRPRHGRPLRLGILSAEFSTHAVAYFLLPWLRALDRRRVTLSLYPTQPGTAAVAARFRALADSWTPLIGGDAAAAARRIRADRIDVLLETSGHTIGNRLAVVAQRAAPVQCHYIGYFATTGLSTLDYFIADEVLVPPEHDAHFVERVWRLPRTRYVYEPLVPAPMPHWRPDARGILWLGSLNNPAKVRQAALALWARVLHELPEARLLLKDARTAPEASRARILAVLAECGIGAERVAFAPQVSSWSEHMAQYAQLDLALDTVPYNSATTACDALWMGVPLVTLCGERFAGRMAASLLVGLGRREWIATTPDDFVARTVRLARDVAQRATLRHTLRAELRASELGDALGLATVLAADFARMFDAAHGG